MIFSTLEMKLDGGAPVEHFNFFPGGFTIITHFKKLFTLHLIKNAGSSFLQVIFNLFLYQFIAFSLVVYLGKEFFRLHKLGRELLHDSFLLHGVH